MRKSRLLFTIAVVFTAAHNLYPSTITWGVRHDSIYWEAIGDDFEAVYSPRFASTAAIPMYTAVDTHGAATITVPLDMPDAGSALTPALAFYYNSMRSYPMFGNDWGMQGLSEIYRVNKSIYYDGAVRAVKADEPIDGSEAFALDGCRLIVTANNFPASVTYKSETGNIKVKAYIAQRCDSLTANQQRYVYSSFKVFYPDGRTAVFGYEQTEQNKSLVQFPVTKTTGPAGSSIHYEYIRQRGHYRISRIRFGWNQEAQAAFRYEETTIAFKKKVIGEVYDIPFCHMGGLQVYSTPADPPHKINTGCILRQVSVSYNGTNLSDYNLVYRSDGKYVFLTEIHLAKGSAGSAAYTVPGAYALYDEYGGVRDSVRVLKNDSAGFAMPLRFRYGEKQSPDFVRSLEQMTCEYRYPKSRRGAFGPRLTNGIVIYPKADDYDFRPSNLIQIRPDLDSPAVFTIEAGEGFAEIFCFDWDGKPGDEIIRVNNYLSGNTDMLELSVYAAAPEGPPVLLHTHTYWGRFPKYRDGGLREKEYFTGDFTGNGSIEILAVCGMSQDTFEPYAVLYNLQEEIKLYEGCIFEDIDVRFKRYPRPYLTDFHVTTLVPGDFNGDGKTELFYKPIDNEYAAFMEFIRDEDWGYTPAKAGRDIDMTSCRHAYYHSGDFNGDGLTDIYATGHRGVFLSDGGGLIFKAANIDYNTNWGNYVTTEDVNGDGQSDLTFMGSGGVVSYLFSGGSVAAAARSSLGVTDGIAARSCPAAVSSGRNELIFFDGSRLTRMAYGVNLSKALLITRVKSGAGIETSFTYGKLTDDPQYSPSTDVPLPYYSMVPTSIVVHKMRSRLGSTLLDAKDYRYHNGIMHKQGLGFCGFEKITVLDSIRGQTIENTFDPYNFGVLKTEESPVHKTTHEYSIDVSADKLAVINRKKSIRVDKLKNTTTTYTRRHDQYGCIFHETIVYGDVLRNINLYGYLHHDTEEKYHIGLPTYHVSQNTAGGESAQTKLNFQYSADGQVVNKKTYYNSLLCAEEITPRDAAGNVLSQGIKPYAGTVQTKTFEYDSAGRTTAETDPAGMRAVYAYNEKGQLACSTDIYGKTTRYEYDSFGRLVKTTLPTGTVQHVEYRRVNFPGEARPDNIPPAPPAAVYAVITRTVYPRESLTMPAPEAGRTAAFYNVLDQEIRTGELRFDDSWLLIDKIYDSFGRLWKESLPFKGSQPAGWNTYSYDSYDRPADVKYASGKKESWTYSGNSTAHTKDGIKTVRTYNAAGQLVRVDDPGGSIAYTYCPGGQHKSISVHGAVTTFTYDSYGRRTSINDPSAGIETTAYDAAGNISRQTDAAGRAVIMRYDGRRRLLAKKYPEFTTTYSYNAKNQLAAETSTNGTSKTFSYDSFGRLSSEQENTPGGRWLKKTYTYKQEDLSKIEYTSHAGKITEERYTYKNGHAVSMQYAATLASNPWQAKNNFNGPVPKPNPNYPVFWQLEAENDMGLPVKAATGPITRTYGYDAFGLPVYRRAAVSGKDIFSHEYRFSPLTGNLEYWGDGVNNTSENFEYDSQNRLLRTQTSGAIVRYHTNGNIRYITGAGMLEYKQPGRPYALTGVEALSTQQLQFGEDQQITYTSFKRPAVISSGGYTTVFTYNASGSRAAARRTSPDGTVSTKYYIGGQYEEENGRELLYLGGDVYTAPAVLIREGIHSRIYYICRNYQGSISCITNSAGEKVQELSYNAWGRLRHPATHAVYAPGEEPVLFLGRGYTGHEHLQEHGLINMNARLYDPVVGRFLSPDPYVQNPENTQNYNRYSYALNNPLKYTDPTGEQYRYNSNTKGYEDKYGNVVAWEEVYAWMNDTRQFVNPINCNSNSTAGWDIGGGYYNPGFIYFNNTTGQMRFLVGSKKEPGTTLRTIGMTGNIYGMGNARAGGLNFANMVAGAVGFEVGGLEIAWEYSSKASQNKTLRTLQRALKDHGKNVRTNAIRSGISKTLKATGRIAGYAGVGITTADMIINSQVNASNLLDFAVTGAAFVPVVGWAISGGYFIADMITLGVSGQTIGGHLNNSVGGALFDWNW